MPANTTPLFVLTPNIGKTTVTAANVATDGSGTIGTNIFLAFTAGANGSRVESITITNAVATATTSAATRISCYYSTVTSGVTTSSNTYILNETTLAAGTARSATNTGVTATISFPGGLLMPSGTTILITSSNWTAAANDNLAVVVRGGDY